MNYLAQKIISPNHLRFDHFEEHQYLPMVLYIIVNCNGVHIPTKTSLFRAITQYNRQSKNVYRIGNKGHNS